MPHPDICIAGAGIIGLSLALELHHRGARVSVFDQAAPLTEASTAAAGMLAARDPDNPPRLRPLADLSLSLYPAYINRLQTLSGLHVPFHSDTTLQSLPPHALSTHGVLTPEELSHLLPQLVPAERRFILLDEHSLDPRELARALLAAVRATPIELRPNDTVRTINSTDESIEVHTSSGTFSPSLFVDCTGAWSNVPALSPHLQVSPKKGQMLAVSLPSSLPLHFVVRTPEVYIVPRAAGPTPTRAIIGATVEDAGFDKTVRPADIAQLRALASELLPDLADAPLLESWAGLRPSTPDALPILGPLPGRRNHFIATGHYRNGILLAPATAFTMAQMISGQTTAIDLSPYSPDRVAVAPHCA